jgi:ATP-dependent RNA helicase DeaD
MPKEIFRELQKVWVVGQQLRISRLGGPAQTAAKPKPQRHEKPRHRGR